MRFFSCRFGPFCLVALAAAALACGGDGTTTMSGSGAGSPVGGGATASSGSGGAGGHGFNATGGNTPECKPLAGDNLLSNGGFEQGLGTGLGLGAEWRVFGADATVVNDPVWEGAAALSVCHNGTAGNSYFLEIDVDDDPQAAAHVYGVTACVRAQDAGASPEIVSVDHTLGSFGNGMNSTNAQSPPAEWVPVSTQSALTEGTGTLVTLRVFASGAGSCFLLDGVYDVQNP